MFKWHAFVVFLFPYYPNSSILRSPSTIERITSVALEYNSQLTKRIASICLITLVVIHLTSCYIPWVFVNLKKYSSCFHFVSIRSFKTFFLFWFSFDSVVSCVRWEPSKKWIKKAIKKIKPSSIIILNVHTETHSRTHAHIQKTVESAQSNCYIALDWTIVHVVAGTGWCIALCYVMWSPKSV